MSSRFSTPLAALLIFGATTPAVAQQTVGLFVNDERASKGYTLFGPKDNTSVHLINNDGLEVHSWETSTIPTSFSYLLPDGHLLRGARTGAGNPGTRIQEFDWDGNVVWDYLLLDADYRQHHDIEPMPNGNVLFIARETRSEAEAIQAGRDPTAISEGTLSPDIVVELEPLPPNGGQIVWEWRTWDHLIQDFDVTKDSYGVVADHPELIDINYGGSEADWTHANSVAYDPDLDQVILSIRKFDEIWVIDHSTTTAQAAGHTGGNSGRGGDLLFRWGNPAAYGRGTAADQELWGQHDAQWIPPGYPGEGNILVFDNGWGLQDAHSAVDEITVPLDEGGVYTILPGEPFGPADTTWTYTADPPEEFYSSNISGAERRPEGTTLICEGAWGRLFEVTEEGETIWEYVNPIDDAGPVPQGTTVTNDHKVFKVRRYSPDYPAFDGRDLTPGDPLEEFNAPLPPPDASLTAARVAADQVQVEWDAAACTSVDYHLLYGPLAEVADYTLSGADCNTGTTGTHVWSAVPPGSFYFLVVGTDDTGVYESSWGRDSFGNERFATKASFRCGTTTKVVSSTCP